MDLVVWLGSVAPEKNFSQGGIRETTFLWPWLNRKGHDQGTCTCCISTWGNTVEEEESNELSEHWTGTAHVLFSRVKGSVKCRSESALLSSSKLAAHSCSNLSRACEYSLELVGVLTVAGPTGHQDGVQLLPGPSFFPRLSTVSLWTGSYVMESWTTFPWFARGRNLTSKEMETKRKKTRHSFRVASRSGATLQPGRGAASNAHAQLACTKENCEWCSLATSAVLGYRLQNRFCWQRLDDHLSTDLLEDKPPVLSDLRQHRPVPWRAAVARITGQSIIDVPRVSLGTFDVCVRRGLATLSTLFIQPPGNSQG